MHENSNSLVFETSYIISDTMHVSRCLNPKLVETDYFLLQA